MGKQSEATLLLKIKSTGESILGKTKAALGDIKTWATAAFAALTSGAAINAFKEAEAATNKLNQSLINQGIYTKGLSEEYQKMATDLQAVTTFEDDAIVNAQATMQSYLGQTKISKELMTATLDLAAAKKIDLATAAEMVGKSIGTSTNMLAKQGIKFEEGATKADKMGKVLSGLTTLAGGMAEAQTKGLGAITQAKNAVGNLLELVGEKLAPFVIYAAQAITKFATAITSNQDVMFWFEFILINLAKGATIAINMYKALGTVLLGAFTAIFDAVMKLSDGDLKGAWQAIKDGASDTGDVLADQWDQLGTDLNAIDDVYVRQKLQKQQDELNNLKKSENRKNEIVKTSAQDMEAFFKTMDDKEINRQRVHANVAVLEHVGMLNKQIAAEKDLTKKLALEKEKREYLEAKYAEGEKTARQEVDGVIQSLGIKRVDDFRGMLDNLSNLQNSKSKLLVGIGKAAALANIAIHTAEGSIGAYKAMSGIPMVGPGLGVIAATSLVAYGGTQAAEVAGIELAQGGIVRATPGGVHAIIGEGGRDEAVIPLEDGKMIGGTTVNLVVQGGFLGDRQDAKEFAIAVDRELFRLRQSNQSMAFDRGVI